LTIYRLVASGTTEDEVWECTLHVSGGGAIAAAQDAWVGAWGAAWNGNDAPTDNLNQLMATTVETTSLFTSQLDPVTFHQVAKIENDATLAGTATGDQLPPQCSVVITWLTALASKNGRGRMYLPPFSVDAVAAGRLSAADSAIVLAAGKNLINAMSGSGFTPVVFNRKTGVGTPITRVRTGNVFNTQKGRLDKLVPVYLSTGL
jgi:hypothetical protein